MVGAGTGGPVSNYVLIVRDIRKLHGIQSFHLNLLPALVTQDVHSVVCPMCQTDVTGRHLRGVCYLSDRRHRTSTARCVPSVRHTPQDVHGEMCSICQTHATGRLRRGAPNVSDTRHRTSCPSPHCSRVLRRIQIVDSEHFWKVCPVCETHSVRNCISSVTSLLGRG